MSEIPLIAEKAMSKLEEDDIKAQIKLQKMWLEFKKKHKISQTKFAENYLGWTQANFSQYLTGQIRIGERSLKKLCAAFNCNPWDIREELKGTEETLIENAFFDIVTISRSEKLPASVIKIIDSTMKNIEGKKISEKINKKLA